jgi:hypothetical protein
MLLAGICVLALHLGLRRSDAPEAAEPVLAGTSA